MNFMLLEKIQVPPGFLGTCLNMTPLPPTARAQLGVSGEGMHTVDLLLA